MPFASERSAVLGGTLTIGLPGVINKLTGLISYCSRHLLPGVTWATNYSVSGKIHQVSVKSRAPRYRV